MLFQTLSTVVVAITSDTPLPTVIQWLTSYARIADLTSELARDTAITSPFVAAHGGVADVYRVTRSDRKQLAIKCLRRYDPKHVKVRIFPGSHFWPGRLFVTVMQRTARELRIWSNLKHKNVLELYGLGVFQGYLAIVSPWMVYGSVVSVVKKWPDMNRYILCRQLIAAIEYLHHVDVIHGDIKGENVLVAEDGILKLADFGLSVMHDNTFQFSQTDPGGGTSRWMAPELWTEYGQRSSEADVYAMGMTMFEIITGKPPFYEIESTHQIVIKVLQERCTPQVPELQSETAPPEARLMYNILQWCWKYEPRERPTAQEVVALTNELTD
ncbi:hypothetical protein FRC12_002053 [Ceratobasidium sp. 428]|nr:hypothetical protein FRC12_002053 [Ceratobasidium sp. 428]